VVDTRRGFGPVTAAGLLTAGAVAGAILWGRFGRGR